jgi:hypothetical protein
MKKVAPAASLGLAGFLDAPEPSSGGYSINIEGLEGTGKTHLALTGPAPIAYLYGDRNAEDVLRQAAKQGVAVYPQRFIWTFPPTEDLDVIANSARPVWTKFVELYHRALNSQARTVVVDTGSFFWELRRAARFGKLLKVPPIMYAEINTQFSNLINSGRDSGRNVVWVHRLQDEWRDAKNEKGQSVRERTGKYVRQGFKELGYEVQLSIRTERADEIGAFSCEVRKCTPADLLVGQRFEGREVDLTKLLALVEEV